MKKMLAMFLTAVLLCTAAFTAIPASAEGSEPILATPLTGYTPNVPFWQYVSYQTVMPEATKKFVTADGIKLSAASEYTAENTKESNALASALYNTDITLGYDLPANFAAGGSFITYVKTDSANKAYFMLTTTYGDNWGTTAELAANAQYQYAAIGSSEWTTAAADENGLIDFPAAFEGYIKFSTASLVSLDNVTMNFNKLEMIGIRFMGIGGSYGNTVAGPFFVTTSDSFSTKITVPEEYQPEPIEAVPMTDYTTQSSWEYDVTPVMPKATETLTPALAYKFSENYNGEVDLIANGFGTYIYNALKLNTPYTLPADFKDKGCIIFYLKTDAANQFVPWIEVGYYSRVSNNGAYEYLEIGGSEWISASADENGIIKFDNAFDGFIKIPASSLMHLDGYALTFESLKSVWLRIGGVGGKFGSTVAGPVLVANQNSASTKITVPEEYRPAPLNVSSFDFKEVRVAGYNYSASKAEDSNNYKLFIDESVLSEEPVKHQGGVEKWSYVENADGTVASDGATALVMTPTVNTYMKDAQGMVFYVSFPKANAFSPSLTFDSDPNRTLTLKPGEKVYLLQNGAAEWSEKTVVKGHSALEIIFGMVTFDAPFEGYIKVPFSSFNNDGGFKPVFSGDSINALTALALRFKGIGDDTMYGKEVVAGVTGYYTADTARPEIGTVALPDYPAGDANYDWKVNTDDLVSVRKTLIGASVCTGYEVSLLDLIKIKKILADITA